jgi:CDP-diacylglycerol--serine O-phosphatidyltransferase
MKRHIPNFITVLNLMCGCLGIVIVLTGAMDVTIAAYLIVLAGILDFFDGFVARLLNVKSEIGKQLDSLADMVTFGVLPSVLVYYILLNNTQLRLELNQNEILYYLPAFFIAAFSALRLAKFNIDTRQVSGFIGMPTPANALFVGGFVVFLNTFHEHGCIHQYTLINYYSVYAYIIIASYLMVSEIPMLSLKFSNFSFQENFWRYLLLFGCVVILIASSAIGYAFLGISLSIVYYVLLSVVCWFLKK